MIKVEGLSKNYGLVKAVDHISFEVAENQNLILLGTSGCGKTTTLKMINRLINPSEGRIWINGVDITKEQPETLRRKIGYVLQNYGLFPHYTVAQNIAIVPQLLKWDKHKIQKRTLELLEKLHLPADILNTYPSELSGGQQQRIGLARALAANPPVLLMDEPFGALDNVTKANIHAEFLALDELKQKTIIMVTHDVQEAFELGDRICLMDKGKIVQDGSPTELLLKPVNDFVAGFLKEQQLLLEFKTTKVLDLWALLNVSHLSNIEPTVNADLDLWTLIELIKKQKIDTITIQNSANGEVKTLRFEAIMQAFYQYIKAK
jgi:osmoprotectant transport system ATP-binding protein